MSASDPSDPVVPSRRPAALAFVFVTVALDVLALGIIVPVLPRLVVDFMGGNAGRTAHAIFLFGTCWAAMQFVSAPVLGALSDRFGRRPVILLSNFGSGLDYVLMALAPSLGWLFVGRVVSGITTASIPTASAYVADVTPPEKRAASFGLLGAAFGLGFIVGPALGGLLGQVNPRGPFWAAAVLSLANAAYGFFVLPESLARGGRAAFSWRRANPVAALGLLGSHPELLGLATVSFLVFLAHEVFPNIYVVYTIYRFNWDTRTIGLTLTAAGVCSALVQGVLVRSTVARLGERATILLGVTCLVVGFALYALADRSWLFWLAVPLAGLGGLSQGPVQSIMSRHVHPSEQGRLQGANSSIRGITGMMGPGLFAAAFAQFRQGGWWARHGWNLPGMPFFISSLLVVAALAAALRALAREPVVAMPVELEPVPPPAFTSDVP